MAQKCDKRIRFQNDENRIQGPKFAESYRQEKLAILGIFGDIGNFSDKETKIQILFNNEKNLK